MGPPIVTVSDYPDLQGVTHPAKFSIEVLDAIDVIVPEGVTVLDPFAGVGFIHRLKGRSTIGVELEPEWASVHPRTIQGNALALPIPDESVPWVVTSPCYGNRMADHHDAKEKCRPCGGTGEVKAIGPLIVFDPPTHSTVLVPCSKCEGFGFRTYRRLTYRHQIGHALHVENSGALQWGPKYRAFHEWAWTEVRRVLTRPGFFVLDIKNHWRDHKLQRVMEWHLGALVRMGFEVASVDPVEVKGMGLGQNRDVREPHEFVILFTLG